jgi:hypothetical protein
MSWYLRGYQSVLALFILDRQQVLNQVLAYQAEELIVQKSGFWVQNISTRNFSCYNRRVPNLHSTINSMGKTVTQIIHFSNGNKRTFSGIITETIKQGEFTKMTLKDGRMLMVNTANVDCIEVFDESIDKQMHSY